MLPELTRTAGRLHHRRMRRRGLKLRPHPGSTDGEQAANAGKSGALRAAVFGINDGLVSNVSLIMGVAAAGVHRSVVLIAGIAGLLAGAFSMAAGEYISMRVQREVFERLIHLEAHEIGSTPDEEQHELAALYVDKGLSPELAAKVSAELMRDPRTALETHAREELGLDPEEGLGSPWGAALSSFVTFSFGALVPLLPFFFGEDGTAVVVSAAVSGAVLFAVGALMSVLTGRNAVVSGLRQLGVGAAAAAITYLVGSLLNVAVSG
jgi:VIT1/CCC1 family predicted Fe2+/Mn2+ transporter